MKNLDSFSAEILSCAVVVGLSNNDTPVYQSTGGGKAPDAFKIEGYGNSGINFFKAVHGCPGLYHRWYANGFLDGARNSEFYIYF